jgi:hypothetical protein
MSNRTSPASDASPSSRSWRDDLPVHPAAELFPIMTDTELVEMGNDIEKRGLQQAIVIYVDPNGKEWLLDARNRLAAMEAVGIGFKLERNPICWEIVITSEGEEYDAVRNLPDTFGTRIVQDIDPYDYVISANIRRRQLTAKQKREVIGRLLNVDPGKSNREIGGMIGVDHKTVALVRAEKEASGEFPHIDHPKTTNKAKTSRGPKPSRQDPAAPGDTAKPAPADPKAAASADVTQIDPAIRNTKIAAAAPARSPDDAFIAEISEELHQMAALQTHRTESNWDNIGKRLTRLLSLVDSVWPSLRRREQLASSQRTFACDNCGFKVGRDINAARNLARLAASSAVSACGEARSGTPRKRRVQRASTKQEENTAPLPAAMSQ